LFDEVAVVVDERHAQRAAAVACQPGDAGLLGARQMLVTHCCRAAITTFSSSQAGVSR
jgi:hypothetical protein